MAAVRKFTTHVASCQTRDGNVFELGHFAGSGSDWLVVVGESGAGNQQASQMVTHASSQFGPFELIVLVGVAATRKADDAPIGSVVAAEHVYWPYVGKYKDGDFQGRPFHLFIKADYSDLAKLSSPKAKFLLLDECGVDLIGVTTIEDFDATTTDADLLLKASSVVLDWPRILPDGTAIERPELSQLLQFTDGEDGHTRTVLGDPGSGKTALLAALAHTLRARDIPFLAIKADILEASTSTEQDLQRDLGLPDLPSRIIERLSFRGPVFLLIDQLDALAGYSVRLHTRLPVSQFRRLPNHNRRAMQRFRVRSQRKTRRGVNRRAVSFARSGSNER
jgi:hypothetical protein